MTEIPIRCFILSFLILAWHRADTCGAAWTVSDFAGTGMKGSSGDGGPAAEARVSEIYGICRSPDGALYICDTDNHQIRKIAPDGTISLYAGTGKKGYSGDGGPALRADLNEPYEIRFDKSGDLFFVDMRDNCVRRIDARSHVITTVAGTGKPGFSGDGGPATAATFNQPHSIAFDPGGNLYVCDIANNRVRKIDMKTGRISTFAGTGKKSPTPDGGKIENSPLNGPRAIDFDKQGNMWLALREGNAVYKLDLAHGTIHHVAGTGAKGFTGNGGPAKIATLSGPKGISVGPDGNVYLADTESHSVRMIDVARGTIELVAGTGQKGDGPPGPAASCKFARPHGIFADADGSLFVGDTENNRVRRVIRK
jgi:DNA-binding beta-propeller fold protein YncE